MLYYWLPVFLYCLAIFIQSSYPTPEQTGKLPHIDKILHLVGYAVLGILFLRGFRNSKFNSHSSFIKVASVVLAGLYGALDELHQHFVAHRSADIWDVFFDFTGALFGICVYMLFLARYPKMGRI